MPCSESILHMRRNKSKRRKFCSDWSHDALIHNCDDWTKFIETNKKTYLKTISNMFEDYHDAIH